MANDPGRPSVTGTQWFFSTPGAIGFLARRTAERDGAFFLPHLRPGLRLLDCGCGPGTITVGLAAAVAPGEVVGIDREAGPLAQAAALAAERGLTNVRFEQGDLHALPFANAAFDAAFLHAILEHVPDPVAAVRAVSRVVRPGGIIGVRSPAITLGLVEPPEPILKASLALLVRLRDAGGGHARIGRTVRSVLGAAGLRAVVAGMSMESQGTLEGTRAWADVATSYLNSPATIDQAARLGLADRATLEEMSTAWRTWAERPDALHATPWGEAVGWVAEAAEP